MGRAAQGRRIDPDPLLHHGVRTDHPLAVGLHVVRRHSTQVKWETVTSGDPVVLVMPGDGARQLPVAQLPTYLEAEAGHL